MFFKIIDKFFDQIKQVISLIVFALIALSLFMIVFWIICIAKVTLPQVLNDFGWGVVAFFTPFSKNLPVYQDSPELLPIFTAIVIAVIIYLLNGTILLLDDIHEKARSAREYCKNNIEKTINRQLKKAFVEELRKKSYMLVKVKIDVTKEKTNLMTDEIKNIDVKALEKEIALKIIAAINADLVQTKGMTEHSVYFLLNNFHKSKQFLMELVSKSTRIINNHIRPYIKINFGCAVDLYENISEFEKSNASLEKVLDLKVSNKILATSATKVYFESLHSELFYFKLLGEYTIKDYFGKTRSVSLYTLQRR